MILPAVFCELWHFFMKLNWCDYPDEIFTFGYCPQMVLLEVNYE